MGAGMLRGWVMLWNMGLIAIVLVLGAVALAEVVTSIRRDGW